MRTRSWIAGGALLTACAASTGCSLLIPDVKVNVNVYDQRTQLENQVRGTYEELSDELLLVASVRGIDPNGKLTKPPPLAAGKEEALRAAQSREFNRDDIEQLMAQGCAGETSEGGVASRPCPQTEQDARYRAFAESLLAEENADRLVLMRRVIATNSDLTDADLGQVRKIFADLNHENARPGWWVQQGDGSWTKKGSS
jgi:uncharacterized protein YdbL (DUF1318 family)